MLRIVAIVVAAATAAAPATAQDWPTRPVTMVVTFAPGTAGDVVGRILSGPLSEALGRTVIVDNVPGGGGITGSNRIAKAAPDGYQFLVGTVGTHAIAPTLYKNPPYNAVTDFAPVGLLLEQPIVLLARKDLPATTLQEFAAYTKVHQKACNTAPAAPGRLIILLAHDSTRHLATTSCMSPIAARRQCRICWPDASTVDSLRSKRTLFR
jgi:tripartite-type tricarboxylate transporter receptor subunit TctC